MSPVFTVVSLRSMEALGSALDVGLGDGRLAPRSRARGNDVRAVTNWRGGLVQARADPAAPYHAG